MFLPAAEQLSTQREGKKFPTQEKEENTLPVTSSLQSNTELSAASVPD